MASRLAVAFEDYEVYHRTSGNKLCHYIGIPVIAFTFVGLLSSISVGTLGPWSLDLAVVVAAAVVLYDFLLRAAANKSPKESHSCLLQPS